MENKNKIALVGLYPPPYGGRSVHVKRLFYLLKKKRYEVKIYPTNIIGKTPFPFNIIIGFLWLIRFIKNSKEDIVHIHTTDWRFLFPTILCARLKRQSILCTMHSYDLVDKYLNSNFIIRKIIEYSLKNCSSIICVNKNIAFILKNKIRILKKNIYVIPAYLPPIENKKINIRRKILLFIEKYKAVLSANGALDKADSYGLGMIIKLAETTKKMLLPYGFIFYIYTIRNKKLYKNLLKRAKNLPLLIISQNEEFYPIFKKTRIFLRPTTSDGDAISIREALHYKIPVVASDAVKRSKGVILFKNRNTQDFIEKVMAVLKNYKHYKNAIKKTHFEENNFYKLVNIYAKKNN